MNTKELLSLAHVVAQLSSKLTSIEEELNMLRNDKCEVTITASIGYGTTGIRVGNDIKGTIKKCLIADNEIAVGALRRRINELLQKENGG